MRDHRQSCIKDWLNNNMRCFEIIRTKGQDPLPIKLNNNMRCFEI